MAAGSRVRIAAAAPGRQVRRRGEQVVLDRGRVEHVAVRVERLDRGDRPPPRPAGAREPGTSGPALCGREVLGVQSQPKPFPNGPSTRAIARQKWPSAFPGRVERDAVQRAEDCIVRPPSAPASQRRAWSNRAGPGRRHRRPAVEMPRRPPAGPRTRRRARDDDSERDRDDGAARRDAPRLRKVQGPSRARGSPPQAGDYVVFISSLLWPVAERTQRRRASTRAATSHGGSGRGTRPRAPRTSAASASRGPPGHGLSPGGPARSALNASASAPSPTGAARLRRLVPVRHSRACAARSRASSARRRRATAGARRHGRSAAGAGKGRHQSSTRPRAPCA